MTIRGVIASMLTATMLLASVPAVSTAQQPPLPPPAPAPPPPPVLMPDVVKSEDARVAPFDIYSVGAGVLTVARMPFHVALCALGLGVSAALLGATFGSAYRETSRVMDEGCGGPWYVSSRDIRPLRSTTGLFDQRMERYQER
jgi:hypothetical protein